MGEGNIGRHFFNTIVSNRMKLPDELIGKRKVHYDSIFDVPMNWFIPAIHDESTMKEEIKILLARDLCHYVPKLKWMKDLLAKHIEHEFSDFTSQRSNVVSYHLLDGYSVIILCCDTKIPSGNPNVFKFCSHYLLSLLYKISF